MKQQIKYTLIPALIMLAGCHESNEFNGNISELVHTNVRQVEYSSIVKNEGRSITTPVYNNATQMVHNDSIFLFLNPNGEYRFTAYNINSKQTKSFVPAGYGEEEGLYYLDLNIHNTTATALDFGCGRLVEIDLTQCFNDQYKPIFYDLTNNEKQPLGAVKCGEKVISTGIYTQGRYCLSDSRIGKENYWVNYPSCIGSDLSDTLKSILYASNYMTLNPEGNRIVCANIQYGCLDICTIEGNRVQRINESHLTLPDIKITKKSNKREWHPVAYSTNNVFGFCDITASEKHIYALYSGRTYKSYKNNVDKGKIIFVFDWSGQHIETFHLDDECISISYDNNSENLYALIETGNNKEIIILHL